MTAAPAETTSGADTSARHRLLRIIVAALAVLVAAGLATAWWLGARSAPAAPGGGWRSPDMESVDVSGLTQTHRVFRCTPGEFETRLDVVADGPVPVTVTDVRVPLLDDLLAGSGRAVRTGTQMMRDPNGDDLDDLVDFHATQVGDADWLRLVLTWDIHECPEVMGYLIEDRIEVTYVAVGMTHTATVPQIAPFALTSLPVNQVP